MMGEAERAYATVHLHRALALLSGNGYGYAAVGGSPHQDFGDSDRQAFRAELERALAWVDGDARPALNVVPLR